MKRQFARNGLDGDYNQGKAAMECVDDELLDQIQRKLNMEFSEVIPWKKLFEALWDETDVAKCPARMFAQAIIPERTLYPRRDPRDSMEANLEDKLRIQKYIESVSSDKIVISLYLYSLDDRERTLQILAANPQTMEELVKIVRAQQRVIAGNYRFQS